jgi:hypothetical protein
MQETWWLSKYLLQWLIHYRQANTTLVLDITYCPKHTLYALTDAVKQCTRKPGNALQKLNVMSILICIPFFTNNARLDHHDLNMSVSVPPLNYQTIWQVWMKSGMNMMPLEAT